LPRRYRPPSRRRKSSREPARQGAAAPTYEDIRPPAAPSRERTSQSGKIGRDHGFVVGELRQIALIVTFIFVGLIITAILR
jgi:hypothetical protein